MSFSPLSIYDSVTSLHLPLSSALSVTSPSPFHSLHHNKKEGCHSPKHPNPHNKKFLIIQRSQSHTYIHIHSHSSSSPSSHSTDSMARKRIHAGASTRQEASSSKRSSKGKEQVPKEEEDTPPPSPRPSPPPRRSTPHPSSWSQRSKKLILHDTKEPSNLDSLDFKNKYGKSHSHFDPSRFISCAAFEFHSQVLVNRHLCASYVVNLENLSEKGIDFTAYFDDLKWSPIFKIRKPVYPNLVREFYANMMFHDGALHSYVKNVHLTLNRDTVSAALGYQDEGASAYIYGKWDNHAGVSLQVALTRVCENFSALDGTNLTHKALGPVRALLHRIITHVLMPQSGSYQRVTVCDTLVLFAILNSASISFAYLMIRHMWDCVRSDKKSNLPYGMFLTCIFEYFNVDLSNEPVENRFSVIKGGGVPDSAKEKKNKSSKASIFTESEDESLPSDSSDKFRFSETIKDVLTEFSNMSSMMVRSYKEARKQAYENEKAWTKCRERINLLVKSLEITDKDMAHSEGEQDFSDSDINLSDA
ncbi:uncharacterized protein DS421_20g678650 [Arachis hypogaea]|nr:uncharacterized protein DS421_20g678650 [Arachis hypogaea]